MEFFVSFQPLSVAINNLKKFFLEGNRDLFIQTRCEAIHGWAQEQLFHSLQSTEEFHPNGYHANVEISMLSDYGDLHIILSETNEKTGPNPSYEIGNSIVKIRFAPRLSFHIVVIADRFGTESEFRRKNSISESYDFVNQTSFIYHIEDRRPSLKMRISLSIGK